MTSFVHAGAQIHGQIGIDEHWQAEQGAHLALGGAGLTVGGGVRAATGGGRHQGPVGGVQLLHGPMPTGEGA